MKEKSIIRIALSFILNNLLAVVACLLLMTLFSFVLDTGYNWIIYSVMLLAFVFFIYHQGWQFGSRDLDSKLLPKTGRVLVGGIIAAVPTLILALLSVLIDAGVYVPQLTFFNKPVVFAIYIFWNTPFNLFFELMKICPILYFLPCVLLPICAVVGYILGYKQLKLSDYLYYARDKKE